MRATSKGTQSEAVKLPFRAETGPTAIAFGSPKGGPGKTTLAVAIAAELHRRCDGPVRLADLDYTANAYKHVCRGIEQERGFRFEAQHLASLVPEHRALAAKVAEMAKGAQYFVLDTPGAIENRGAQTCLQIADIVVLPMTPGMYDLEATMQALALLDSISMVNPEQKQMVVINRPQKTRLGMQIQERVASEIEAMENVFLAKTQIRQAVGFNESAVTGLPLWCVGSSGRSAALDVAALCDEILSVQEHGRGR